MFKNLHPIEKLSSLKFRKITLKKENYFFIIIKKNITTIFLYNFNCLSFKKDLPALQALFFIIQFYPKRSLSESLP